MVLGAVVTLRRKFKISHKLVLIDNNLEQFSIRSLTVQHEKKININNSN